LTIIKGKPRICLESQAKSDTQKNKFLNRPTIKGYNLKGTGTKKVFQRWRLSKLWQKDFLAFSVSERQKTSEKNPTDKGL